MLMPVLLFCSHVYTGTFTEDESLWQELKTAGEAEHDRFWRMPGAEDFMYSIAGSNADLCNKGSPAGSACAAVFLKQFVEGLEDRDGLESGEGKAKVRYAHLVSLMTREIEMEVANRWESRKMVWDSFAPTSSHSLLRWNLAMLLMFRDVLEGLYC